jgi:hypothetical protein
VRLALGGLVRSEPRRLSALIALVLALLAAKAGAAEPERAAPDTFEYTRPTEKNYLRAILELEGLTTVSVVWYVMAVRKGGDVGYGWPMFEKKLSGTAFAHDDNAFGTNFHGHGLGGNVYYLSARSNHLSIPESFGFAVAGATLWEYFGEVSEIVSINDLIVTPFSGIGIGEPLLQFSAFLDRQQHPSFVNRAFAAVFGPLKTVNDALDGAQLKRASTARDEWHRFELALGPAYTRSQVDDPNRSLRYHTETRIALAESLARLPDYDFQGAHSQWFDDGNLSGISLDFALGARGISDFALSTNVVPFGYYWRNARVAFDGEVRGSGIVAGFEMGYHYLSHDYGDSKLGGRDHTAFIKPVGAMVEYHASFGKASLTSRIDAMGIYGGVHPMASGAFGPDRSALAPVLRHFDYYFGAGAELKSALSLRYGRLEAEGSLLARGFTCVDEHVQQSISDTWQRFAFAFSYRILPAWAVRAFSDDTRRAGRLATARGSAHESATGIELRSRF